MQRKGCNCRIWRVYLWTCAASLASCLVGVLALGSPVWTEGAYGDYEHLQTGLLLFCHHRNTEPQVHLCAPLMFGSQERWLEAVRVLSLLSWMLMFTELVMSALLHFQDDSLSFSLPTVIVGIVAATLGIIGAFVFVIPWTTQEVVEQYDVSISWGYGVNIVWHVISLLLFILIAVTGRDIWYSAFKAKRRH